MKFLAALLFSLSALAQGILTAGNAASGSPNIAPGSLLAINESFVLSQIGPGDLDPLHSTMSLQPQNSGPSIPLPILPTSTAYTVYGVVPKTALTGPASIILAQDGRAPIAFPVNLVPASPGLFPQSGPAMAQNISATAPPSRNGLSNPAIPRQYITLWGTGLGTSTIADIFVQIAGQTVTPSYAGPVSVSPGMDQINFQLPANVSTGCYVPLSIRAGNALSNEVTIAVSSSPGACQHPLGLAPPDLQTLDQGGRVLFGSITISRSIAAPELLSLGFDSYEGASAQFGTQNALSFFALSQTQLPDSQFYVCQVPGVPLAYFVPDGSNDAGDAGPVLALTGADGRQLDLRKIGTSFLVPSAGGDYTGSPGPTESFFGPGPWTLSAPGGTTIAAFQQPFALPALHWLNRNAFSIVKRDTGATIWWDTRSVASTDVMAVRLSNPGYADLTCRTRATSGRLTLPSVLLQQLSPSAETVLSLTLAPHPAHRLLFRLPLTAAGTAPAVLDYSITDARLVNLQ